MEDAIQSSVYVSSPEFAGWLTKRGFAWRKLWKKKWVALHGDEIVYMDKEPNVENASSLTITKAQITASTEISNDDLEGNPAGFTIHINDGHSPTWYLRADSERQKKQWILRLSYIHAIMKWLGDFEKVKVLGVGGTGIVYELLHCTNGTRFAMKEMEIKNAHQMQMAVSEAEMLKDIMENVSHPNVMHIEKVFQVGSKFYLVFPLCTGGELYEHIIKRGHFTEHDAAVIMRDLISGLAALHAHDILHLDIKPENILFESNADDARIKITDFGLSKIYNQEPDSPPAANASTTGRESTSPVRESRASRRFSMELMGQKMKAFLDNSELNIDRLKGTIGYMSPELILTGHCTKATDVFAAGVVLYILLSGRPPFNSRSNREVLEKTVRGAYKMSGIEWNDISDQAKDLVKRMLCTNPEQRITAEEILQHPWIKELDGVSVPTPTAVVAGSSPPVAQSPAAASAAAAKLGATEPVPPVASPVGKKLSNINLTGALRALSGHVKHLQSEKLATSVTRLVSSMQNGGSTKGGGKAPTGGSNTLSNLYLVPMESASNSPKEGGSEASALSPKSAAAMEKAEDTRLRNDQDLMMLMNSDLKCALTEAIDHLALTTNEDGSPNTSGTVSHDNVGRLTIEQMMVILKHFEFIPASMSVIPTNANKASIGALMFCRFLDRDGDGYISVDDISTAQALIMQRNEVFLKMIFRVYIESLWYPGRNLNVMNVIQTTPLRGNDSSGNLAAGGGGGAGGGGDTSGSNSAGGSLITPVKRVLTENNMPVDKVEPPKIITGRHVAAVFEKLGYDPAAGQKVFSILFEAVARLKNADSTSEKLPKTPNSRFNNSSALRTPGIAEEAEDGSRGSSEEEVSPSTTQTGTSTPIAPTPTHQQKMDYSDFAKAIEIDDIFLQVIFRKPRSKLINVVRRVSGSNFSAQAGAAVSAGDQDRNRAASSAVIENEFKEAFKNIKVQQSVFQKGMSAAFGLAAKFTSAAGALFDTTEPDEEPEDSDDEFHKHTLTG